MPSDSPYPSIERKPVASLEPAQQFRGGRCGAADAEPHRRRVGANVVGQRGQHGVDRGHRRKERGSVAFDGVEEGVRIKPLGDDDTGTGEQRHQHADHDAVDVKQRQDQQTPVRRPDVQRLASHLGHRIEVGVVKHHALGHPGGAAGEDQQRQRRRIHQRWPIPTRTLRVEIPDGQRRDPARTRSPRPRRPAAVRRRPRVVG